MDGDLGYHLMATYVPPELMAYRNRQRNRQQERRHANDKSSKIVSTWTTAAASFSTVESTAKPTTESTVLSAASTSALSRTARGALRTGSTSARTARTTATTSTSASPLIINPLDTYNLTIISTNPDTNPESNLNVTNVVDVDETTASTSNTSSTTGCVSGTPDEDRRANAGHLHECREPPLERELKLEPSTAHARPSLSERYFDGHRSRLSRPSARAIPSLATQLAPAFASPPIPESPESTPQAQLSNPIDDPVSLEGRTSPRRRHRPDFFQRRSLHSPLRLPSPSLSPTSPTSKPLAGTPSDHSHTPHRSMLKFPIASEAPFPTTYHIPGDMPRSGNHAFSNQSGITISNEDLGSSAERSGGALSTVSIATSTASKSQLQLQGPRAFITRNGRTYINDTSLPYPLPVDLAELHRQSLRTLLMFQLFGGPIVSSVFASKPPTRVLDVGCGAGFWSMMCHRYFAQHGHSSISFTGLDIVPLGGSAIESRPDKDMRWRFVQHDMRQFPWPFADGEFDLVMVKDMSLTSSFRDSQPVMEEYLRVLRPGGVLEFWETDSSIRMLRPHAPRSAPLTSRHHDDDDSSSDGGDNEDNAERMGAYVMTTNTPISAPLNTYLVEYNGWLARALEQRGLSAVPCTLVGAYLLQEAESLMDVQSKRLAVPLSEIRWEREGVGGVVTKDGKSYIDSQKGKFKDQEWKAGSPLNSVQSALRRTALETTVSFILALEPLLRETGNKSQEEWDTWAGKMANDLLRDGGTSWGECLEVGVWTSRKRHNNS